MKSHNAHTVAAALASLAVRSLADLNRGHVGIFRCRSGTSPWEWVVPRGLWRRHHVPTRLVEPYVTPGPTDMSHSEDPR